MIVCSCNVFSDHQLQSAIAKATRWPRISQIYGYLGGSPQCGRCAHTIKRIMEKITANGPAPTAAVRRDGRQCQEDRPVRKVGPGDDFLL
jgi:bacterioferritin-associated ferredoxin